MHLYIYFFNTFSNSKIKKLSSKTLKFSEKKKNNKKIRSQLKNQKKCKIMLNIIFYSLSKVHETGFVVQYELLKIMLSASKSQT